MAKTIDYNIRYQIASILGILFEFTFKDVKREFPDLHDDTIRVILKEIESPPFQAIRRIMHNHAEVTYRINDNISHVEEYYFTRLAIDDTQWSKLKPLEPYDNKLFRVKVALLKHQYLTESIRALRNILLPLDDPEAMAFRYNRCPKCLANNEEAIPILTSDNEYVCEKCGCVLPYSFPVIHKRKLRVGSRNPFRINTTSPYSLIA